MNLSLSATQNKILRGKLLLPSSKSISNRLLILRELCKNDFAIENLSDADDTVLLQKLLIQFKHQKTLDAANAGTVLRFMTALLAANEGEWLLSGSERMMQRPVGPLVEGLRIMGANIDYIGEENFPPLKISGKTLQGGYIAVDGSVSSQFVSALLLVAPFLHEGLIVELKGEKRSAPYIDMTLALLRYFGVNTKVDGPLITVYPGAFHPKSFTVEPDWSAASYWYLAASLMPDAEILLAGLSLNSIQGDSALAAMYEHFGVVTVESENGILIRKTRQAEKRVSFDLGSCPDLFPAIAVSCAALGVEATLSGLENLRLKESDRIEAVAEGLRKCGIRLSVTEKDELLIFNDKKISTADVVICSFGDHRIAMAFAQLVWHTGSITIDDMSVCAKSYPGFLRDMETMGASIGNSKF